MGVEIRVALTGIEARFQQGDVHALVSALLEPQPSADDLQHLVEQLKTPDVKEQERDALAAQIKREAPKFSKLAELLPKTRQERIEYIQLAIQVALLILTLLQSGSKQTNITVNQVVNQITIQRPAQTQNEKPSTAEPKRKKPKRGSKL